MPADRQASRRTAAARESKDDNAPGVVLFGAGAALGLGVAIVLVALVGLNGAGYSFAWLR